MWKSIGLVRRGSRAAGRSHSLPIEVHRKVCRWVAAVVAVGALLSPLSLDPCFAHGPGEPSVEWVRQLTTSDLGYAVSLDSTGNLYITGYGLVDPVTNENDAYVDKYDAAGNHLWTRTISTDEDDRSHDIAIDATDNFYITGPTLGSLYAPKGAGGQEAFIGKYSTAGNLVWGRQQATTGDMVSNSVSLDSLGNIFIAGYTSGPVNGDYGGGISDAFISKYDSSGNFAWSRDIGTAEPDWGNSVSADGLGNAYVAGETRGVLDVDGAVANYDAYVRKYDSSGAVLWTHQIGTTGDESSTSVSVDALGNVFVAGSTGGTMADETSGLDDIYIQKLDAAGNRIWTRQFGTEGIDSNFAVQTDGLGNVYVAGATVGDLGAPNSGALDIFVAKLGGEGNLLWINQFGSEYSEQIYGLALKEPGTLYMAGSTDGILDGMEVELSDAVLVKIVEEVPEPTTALLALFATAFGLYVSRRRK